MAISDITDPQAKLFIAQFLSDREINKEFYKRVPEDRLDFRMFVWLIHRKEDLTLQGKVLRIKLTQQETTLTV